MTYTVLDIGAGSLAFGKALAQCNRHLEMLIFCGEPSWGIGPFFRPIPDEKAEYLIKSNGRGVKRLVSTYGNFHLPDNCLDLVTLNAPNPFSFGALARLSVELDRCLRPDGLFLSSWPAVDLGRPPKDFVLLREAHWNKAYEVADLRSKLPSNVAGVYPQSFTIINNIKTHISGNPRAMGSRYLYSGGISPGYRLWKKP